MDTFTKDRRRTSYRGLLESAIQNATKLGAASDPSTRTIGNKILTDLLHLRKEMPARREYDIKPPRKDV